jgi:formate hydrogenlyase transcriptional activator
VRRFARKLDKAIRGIDPETLRRLEAYSWPGNVRELQNVIERSVIVCESETFAIDPGWSESAPAPDEPSADSPSVSERGSPGVSTLAEVESGAILRALQSCNGVVGGPRGAAAQLGLKRTTLQARMKKLGIRA